MGIFEIIIFLAAAVIFIILVRRFPETSEEVAPRNHTSSRRFNLKLKLPKFNLNKLPKPHIPLSDRPEPEPVAEPKPMAPSLVEPNLSQYQNSHSSELTNLLTDGQKYFDLRQFEMAEKLYINAAATDPKCVIAYYRLGQIYLDKASSSVIPSNTETKPVNTALTDAEEAFMQAYKFNPDNSYILYYLGKVAQVGENYNEAVDHFEQAIATNDKIALWHFDLGQTFLSLRQYSKAVRYLSRAWSLEPRNSNYKNLLDDAKERERRQRINKL